MRARLALAVSNCCCELREVVLADKPQEMLDISPKGTVPVLIDIDDRVLEQSLDIMLWALQKSDPQQWLKPEEGSLEIMLEAIAKFDNGFKYHLDRYKYPNRYEDTDPLLHRGEASIYLQELNDRLSQSNYLFGNRIALADMAIAPFIRQFASVDRDWFAGQSWQYLPAWLTEFTNSPLLALVMKKYPKWESGNVGIIFPEVARSQ